MSRGGIIPLETNTVILCRRVLTVIWLGFLLLATGCTPPQVRQGQIQISVNVDGKSLPVEVPAGSTAQDALTRAGVTLAALDRSDPPLYTVLSENATVLITRVREEFEVEQVVIPFERQIVRNESLPEGETRLSQPGANGLQEITYRRLFEDSVEVSKSVVRTVTVTEPIAEIVMVGSQAPFAALAIPGRIAYISAGNAWIMEGTTGNRRPVVTTGDLDGRVFSLSPNGEWLLFTRDQNDEGTINTLWVARADGEAEQVIDLKSENIVHFARFSPESNRVAFSSVEPRATAPGWQANNDLNVIGLSASGFVANPVTFLEANAGGVYGWWGTEFYWSPDGRQLAYARPDSVGLFSLDDGSLTPVINLLPLQTRQDWAWVPGVSWGPDGGVLYSVMHVSPPGAPLPEESPQFDLVGIPYNGGAPVTLASSVGMFSYPITSPIQASERGASGEIPYQVAYLQAVFPNQSDTSRYRLVVMDRDGSNRRILFPQEGAQGLDPQRVAWSPAPVMEDGSHAIAIIYQNNIWLVSLADGSVQQITGDGLASRIDWR